jgi:hypothetical protein
MREKRTEQRRKIEPMWRAISGGCEVAGYSFQELNRRDPPDIDADPILLQFPIDRIMLTIRRMN